MRKRGLHKKAQEGAVKWMILAILLALAFLIVMGRVFGVF